MSSVWTASILCLINLVVKPKCSHKATTETTSQKEMWFYLSLLFLRLLLHNYTLLERIGKYLEGPAPLHYDDSVQTMVVLFAAAHSSVNSISVLSA